MDNVDSTCGDSAPGWLDRLTVTDSDILWLWRKRTGLYARQAASRFGVSESIYHAMEDGIAEVTVTVPLDRFEVTNAERLRLRRRRDPRGRFELCRSLGVSHMTWLKWERRADPRLVAFWEG